ncbi:hypothetical protein [uncultured Nostoc sp.]|uniref:hypothetical protein n=1 Tax=uncultured Nostoc sp. TaxID=340711 RepID=UPI0035CA8A5B
MRIRRFVKVLAALLQREMLVHLLYACSPHSQAAEKTKLTIATVNNGDMVVMQGLSRKFEGFARAPIEKYPNGSNWLWAWALAVPKTSKSPEAAQKFVAWND